MIKRLFHLPEGSPSQVMMDTPNSSQIDFIEFSLERWREGFLRAVLYITAGIGLIAMLLYVFTSSTPLFNYLAVGFYLVFLAFTFLPMPYQFRAGFFVTLLNLISLSTLLDTGVFGSAMAFFLGATVIATLIFSPRVGTIYIFVHLLLLSLVGWATISGQFTLFSGASLTGTVSDWIQNTVYYLLLAIMIVSGVHLLKRDFFLAQGQANAVFNSLKAEQANLEVRIEERTQALATVADISTGASTILETDKLLQTVVDLTKERFNLYHSHIYLLDQAGENLVLASGAGEAGRQMKAQGQSIPLEREQSLVARAARERKGVTVNDVTLAPDFLPNPLLPDTRSELAVPMIVGENVIGVFDVQSDIFGRFTDADINIQTTLASQIAAAIQNARLYTQAETSKLEVQALVDYATEGLLVLDLETGLFNEPNESAAKLYGLPREELVKVGPAQMSPPSQPDGRDSTEKALERIGEAMQNGTAIFEWMHRNAQGQDFLCEIRLVRLPGAHPRLRVTVTNITERRRIEELTKQRARQQEALNLITQKIQNATTIESALQVAVRELGHALGMKSTRVTLNQSPLAGEQNASRIATSYSNSNPTSPKETQTMETGVSK